MNGILTTLHKDKKSKKKSSKKKNDNSDNNKNNKSKCPSFPYYDSVPHMHYSNIPLNAVNPLCQLKNTIMHNRCSVCKEILPNNNRIKV